MKGPVVSSALPTCFLIQRQLRLGVGKRISSRDPWDSGTTIPHKTTGLLSTSYHTFLPWSVIPRPTISSTGPEAQLERSAGSCFPSCNGDLLEQAASGARPSQTAQHYLPFLFLLCFHDMQPLHEAGDSLLQAVNGVVLRIMATEAIAQAAESISDELEVTGLWLKGKCWWHGCNAIFSPKH